MMVGMASHVEMKAHHIQIWPPSCRSTPLERPGGEHVIGLAIHPPPLHQSSPVLLLLILLLLHVNSNDS